MRVATWEHAKHDCFMMRVATWEHAKHDCFMMRVTEHRQNVRIFLILMDTFQWALTGYHRHIDFSTDFVLWCSLEWSWPAQYIPGVSFFLFVQLISLYLTGKWIVLVRKFVAKTVLLIFVFWQQRSLCETNGGYPADLCLLTAAVSLWDQWRLSAEASQHRWTGSLPSLIMLILHQQNSLPTKMCWSKWPDSENFCWIHT